jgi:hypothetical protein
MSLGVPPAFAGKIDAADIKISKEDRQIRREAYIRTSSKLSDGEDSMHILS